MTNEATLVTEDPGAGPGPRRRRPVACLLLLGLAAALFLGYSAPMLGAPFGDSHDGRNAGVWASGSRSLRESGPIRSRLGTRSPENGVYANHPPLVYLETALAETVGLGSRAATRAPAWLGSLAVIGLLGVLLAERGLRPAAVGVAVAAVVATPMFLVYGSMLDTPVTSLPFGVALLVLWERARHDRPVPPVAAGVVAALAVLAGWQSLLVAAVIGGWALVRLRRHRDGAGTDAAFVAGALSGAVLLAAWLLWAFDGSLTALFDQLLFRSGRGVEHVSVSALLRDQHHDLIVMFGLVAALSVAGLAVALAQRPTRALAAVSLAVTVPYTLLLPAGAVNHDYWDYWFILPFAVGLAAGGHRLLSAVSSGRRTEAMFAAGGGLLAVVVTAAVIAMPSASATTTREGLRGGSIVLGSRLPPGQPSAWYTGAISPPAGWWAYAARRPARNLAPAELAALAAARPGDTVLFGDLRCVDGEPHITYGTATAAVLALHPPEVSRCAP